MGKTLILMNQRWEIDKYYIKTINRNNIDIFSIYKVHKGIRWKMAALYMQKMKLPFQSIWYGEWKKKIKQYDTVIIFNCHLNWNIIGYFKRKKPDIRIIAWYWDTLKKEQRIPDKYKMMCEIWSFDPHDCIKYGWKRNVQFYSPHIIDKNRKLKYDAVLVAKDKGRYLQIIDVVKRLENAGKKIYLRIISDKTSRKKNDTVYGKPLPYEELLDIVSKSLAVIEIPKKNQSGLTERTLETLFFEKKLITTNTFIVNEEFYHPSNIFVWNNPSKHEIQEFFDKPYEPIPKEIVDKYTFDAWIRNFEIDS